MSESEEVKGTDHQPLAASGVEAPRRRPLWRMLLAIALIPIVWVVPVEILVSAFGLLFTPNRFLSESDQWLRSLEIVENDLFRPREGEYPQWGFRINSMGFRGPEFPTKDPGTYRILAVGDSTVFGLFVEREEAWPARVETSLDKVSGQGVEVLNMGRVSMSIRGSLQDLELYGDKLDPDAIILSVGWFNEYLKFHDHRDWTEDRAVEEGIFHERIQRANSPLMIFSLFRLWSGWVERGHLARHWEMMQDCYADGSFLPEAAMEPRRVPLDRFRALLEASADWAEKRELPLILTTPALQPADEPRYPIVQAYAREIREFAERRGLPVIETRELLLDVGSRNLENQGEIWIDYVHVNALGYEYLANLIADEVAEAVLIPSLDSQGIGEP